MTNDFALVTMLSLGTTNDSDCFYDYFSTVKIMKHTMVNMCLVSVHY